MPLARAPRDVDHAAEADRPSVAIGPAERADVPSGSTLSPSEVLAIAGTGVVIGALAGAIGRRSDQDAFVHGIAGGAIGLAGGVVTILVTDQADAKGGIAAMVRRNWGLTREVFARLVGYSPRALASYEKQPTLSPVVLRRFDEMGRLRTALEKVMKPDYVTTWLQSPNPSFDGISPLQMIERGEADRVWASAYYMDSGVS